MAIQLCPEELSPEQKYRFYIQETFQDTIFRKNILLSLPLLTVLIKISLNVVLYPVITGSKYPEPNCLFYVTGSICLSGYCLIFLTAIAKKKKWNNQVLIQAAIVCVIWLSGVLWISAGLLNYLERAMTSGDGQDWVLVFCEFSSAIPSIILIYTFVPIWYIKASVGSCYLLAIMIILFKTRNELKFWFFILAAFYISCIFFISFYQSQFRLKLFTQKMEADAWCKVYQNLLNKMPSAIAIMNLDQNVVYSNAEFKRLVYNNENRLFTNLIHIKKRSLYKQKEGEVLLEFIEDKPKPDMRESMDIFSSPKTNLQILLDDPAKLSDNEFIEDFSLGKRSWLPLTKKSTFDELSKRQNILKTSKFQNFAELFEAIKYTFETSEREIDDTNLIFDGKLLDFPIEGESLQKEPNMLSYEIRLFPLYEYNKIIIKLSDTTERDIIAALESNNEYKDRLISSISHELRTPLNANLSFLQAASNEPQVSDQTKQKFIEPALRSGKLLLYIINDILDYSLLQSQELTLNLETKSIRETIANSCKLLEKAIVAKGLNFTYNFDDNLFPEFRTDHGRVSQIILNLLNNALKFTFTGSVTLKASCVGANCVRISVQDTGIGMKESEMKGLFLEAITSHEKHSDIFSKSKGIGLGLKIANKLVKKLGPPHKDAIRAESEEGKGSCFTFFIQNKDESHPNGIRKARRKFSSEKMHKALSRKGFTHCEDDFASLPDIESPADEEKKRVRKIKEFFHYESLIRPTLDQIKEEENFTPYSFHKGNNQILVVDDDPFNIMALSAHLKTYKFSVDDAHNGKAAIEKIKAKCQFDKKSHYKMIFMDCQMPIMDGYEASKALKEMMNQGEIPKMPIIGCTAFTSKSKLGECYKCGMDSVVTKPVLTEQLTEILRQYN